MKGWMLFVSLLFCAGTCLGADYGGVKHDVINSGIGRGSVIAVVTSWERNKSVLLAIIAGVFSWVYVVYYVLTRN